MYSERSIANWCCSALVELPWLDEVVLAGDSAHVFHGERVVGSVFELPGAAMKLLM